MARCVGVVFSPGGQVQRYAADWAASLRAMAALEPELLIPGHGMPIFGRAL